VRSERDVFGSILGILVFLGGVALLVLTFRLAFDMYGVPPERALGLREGEAIDLGMAGQTAAALVSRLLLLLVMAVVGSVIANRGIKLYTESRALPEPRPKDPEAKAVAREAAPAEPARPPEQHRQA
jgi:hypothetical protein